MTTIEQICFDKFNCVDSNEIRELCQRAKNEQITLDR